MIESIESSPGSTGSTDASQDTLSVNSPSDAPLFNNGDRVEVRKAYPIGHCRTPAYFRGAKGIVERHCGAFANPEELAYGRSGLPPVHLYRVRARQVDLWASYAGPVLDTIDVEVFEHWLVAAPEQLGDEATDNLEVER